MRWTGMHYVCCQRHQPSRLIRTRKPSYFTGDGGTHTDREDRAVKAQIIQTGKMRAFVRALTSKTSLPIQGSDSQKWFLSSSSFYPLEQLRTDRWIQSCLWPADPEHIPLEGKREGLPLPCSKTMCPHIMWSGSSDGQRNRDIAHESFPPQLMVHSSAWSRIFSTCYMYTKQQETQISPCSPFNLASHQLSLTLGFLTWEPMPPHSPVIVIFADHFEVPSSTLCFTVFICWECVILLSQNTSLIKSKISGLFRSRIFMRSFMAMMKFWVRSSAPCFELFSAAPVHQKAHNDIRNIETQNHVSLNLDNRVKAMS